LKPQKVKEVKVLAKKEDYLIIKWSDKIKEDYLHNKVNGELSNYGKWLTLKRRKWVK
jgi:hypothetical protein